MATLTLDTAAWKVPFMFTWKENEDEDEDEDDNEDNNDNNNKLFSIFFS